MRKISIALAVLLSFTACVTTPETGRRAFVMTSEGEEAQLGLQAFQEVKTKERVSTNPKWNAVLQRVGQRIAAAANKPSFQWEFVLLESKQVNAFCLPGGKVAFYTGIMPIALNEAGMAAIMGHEVAHATARHGGQRMTQAFGMQLGLSGLSAVLGGGSSTEKNLLMAALGVGANVGVALPFSRSNEAEADEIGMIYMARAGYDPHEAPQLWDRMSKLGGGGPTILSDHPSSPSRKAALEGQLPRALPIYNQSARYGSGEAL